MLKLSERLNKQIQPYSLLEHPFYQAWQNGNLTLDDLRVYAKEYYSLESNFPRFLSRVHSNVDQPEVRKEILKNVVSEELDGKSHRELWLDFAKSLGVSENEMIEHVPMKKTQEAVATFMELASSANWKTGVAALYAYEQQQPSVARTKREGLVSFYGFDPQSEGLNFFKTHEVADQWHSEAEVSVLEKNLHPTEALEIENAAYTAAKALWKFLDGISDQIGLENRESCSLSNRTCSLN